ATGAGATTGGRPRSTAGGSATARSAARRFAARPRGTISYFSLPIAAVYSSQFPRHNPAPDQEINALVHPSNDYMVPHKPIFPKILRGDTIAEAARLGYRKPNVRRARSERECRWTEEVKRFR